VMSITSERKILETVDLTRERFTGWPKRQHAFFPEFYAGSLHTFEVIRLQAPEETRHIAAVGFWPADRQHADHDRGSLIALLQRVPIEAVAPAERRPQGAIGKRFRLLGVLRKPAQLRARAAGVDHKVEGADFPTFAGHQKRPIALLDLLDV